MNKLKIFGICLATFLFLSNLSAQESEQSTPVPNVGSYTILVLNSEIGNNIYFFTQGRIHHYDLFDVQKQFLVRAAIEYKFSKLFKIHLGIATVDKQPFDKTQTGDFEIQRWLYDEFLLTLGNPEKLQFKTRFRHERRWINPSDQVETYMDDILRLRLILVKNLSEKYYAKLFSEGFYSIKNKELLKLRNNLTFGTKLSDELKLEAGVIDEGKIGESSTYLVTRLYINTSWRAHDKKSSNVNSSSVSPQLPVETTKETPREIVFDTNEKVDNIIDDDHHFIQEENTKQEPEKIQEVVEDDVTQISNEVPLEEVVVYSNELRHFVITAAHKDKESTSKSLDRLKRDGYDGQVLEISQNGYYRVSAEDFKDKNKAELTRQNLASIGYNKPWILSTTVTISTVELVPIKEDTDQVEVDDPQTESTQNETKDEDQDQVFDKDSNLMNSDIINIQNQDTELLQRISAQRQTEGKRKFKSPIYHLVIGAVTELGFAPKHIEALRSKGYKSAYVFKKPYGGVYRISAAKSKKIEDLQKLTLKLKADGFKYAWIFDTTLIDYENDLNLDSEDDTVDQNPIQKPETVDQEIKNDTISEKEINLTIPVDSIVQVPINNQLIEAVQPEVEVAVVEEDSIFERNSNLIPYRPIHHVIAASTTDVTRANSIAENLRKMGFVNAYILNSNNTYRVSAAHFKNRTDTKAAIDLLNNQGFKGAWVLIEE